MKDVTGSSPLQLERRHGLQLLVDRRPKAPR
jgi:hypothetical protein